ncbi:hypothetical protein NPIL_486911 [Nephila pilipes]|uniref:Uncharacterized protein n=1 Tax=Nephila pilipes TaxID=299642 RepID=A0A8X6TYC7_NEPPI|nr:hypothetical protein NPIL_486911 [Nephila pilipes]
MYEYEFRKMAGEVFTWTYNGFSGSEGLKGMSISDVNSQDLLSGGLRLLGGGSYIELLFGDRLAAPDQVDSGAALG